MNQLSVMIKMKKTNKKFLLIGMFVLFSLFFFTNSTHAAKQITDAPSQLTSVAGPTGINSEVSVPQYVGNVIKWALSAVGLIFFILMVYAGFKWMLARGNDEGITKARDTVFGAIIGLAIVVASYAITNFITDRVIKGESGPGSTQSDNLEASGLGCCFDKVRHPGDALELRATTWQWKITSEQDCQEEGEQTNSFDAIAGSGSEYWLFIPVNSRVECEATYNKFCQSTTCYDLGF